MLQAITLVLVIVSKELLSEQIVIGFAELDDHDDDAMDCEENDDPSDRDWAMDDADNDLSTDDEEIPE